MVYTTKPPLGTPLDWTHPLNNGLVGFWLFNEGTGDKVNDLSGNNNTGTLTSMAFPSTTTSGWNPGRLGPAIAFDGLDDYINASAITKQPITITMWLKYSSTANQGFVNFVGSDNNIYFGTANVGTQPWLRLGTVTYVRFTSITAYRDNNWHFWVLYLDPITITNSWLKIDNNNIAQDISATGATGTWRGLQFGSGFAQYNGTIDEVRIWSRILSDLETQTLYISPYEMFLEEGCPPITCSLNVS